MRMRLNFHGSGYIYKKQNEESINVVLPGDLVTVLWCGDVILYWFPVTWLQDDYQIRLDLLYYHMTIIYVRDQLIWKRLYIREEKKTRIRPSQITRILPYFYPIKFTVNLFLSTSDNIIDLCIYCIINLVNNYSKNSMIFYRGTVYLDVQIGSD